MSSILKKKSFCYFLFTMVFFVSISAQDVIDVIIVRGTVVDAGTGEALVGVYIADGRNLGNGAMTDSKGQFTINVPQGADLVFSYIGYESATLGATPEMNVRLQESADVLGDVIVIGYGVQRKADLTTAISSVSTEDIERRPIVSAGQAIQGKAAGVMVIQPNGSPGADLTIRVRGTTSFNASNDPLYVVDGVPVDNISFLSPRDIADIQIMKDASSAAIYGSRAANGVILVTTKSGTAKESKITFNAQYGVNQVANRIQSLNAAQYKELMDEIRPGAIPDGTTDLIDWFDEVYRAGITQNYQLSVADGNDRLNYYLSAGYLDEKGVLNAAFFRRYSFRANANNQVRKWLNVSANVSYSENQKNGITTGQGSNRGGVVLAVVNLPTSIPAMNDNGLYNRVFYGQNITNPVEALENGKNNKDRENRIIASGNATITFMPDFTYKSSFTLDRRNYLQTGFTPPVHADDRDDWGAGWDNRNMNTVLVFDNVLNFNRTIDRHSFSVMAGSSWTGSDYTNSWINATHYLDSEIKTLNAANKIAWNNTGTGASQWAIMSYFGRITYNFNNKYLVTANVRTDGSSKLHPDYRWGTFPSFSAAWRISSEDFMKDIEWINDMKIRGGWGQTGNQSGISDYAYLQRYSTVRHEWWITGQTDILPTLEQANLRTKDLRWETTSQTDFGIDLTLLKRRLTLALDYYYKTTTDMLTNVSLPASGSSSVRNIQRNEGEMTNTGFEFTASSRNLQGEFSWNTDFNISFNKNKLKTLEFAQIYYEAETTDALHQTPIVRNEPGRSMGGFYGYINDGVDPETGELIYRDINKDGKVTASDKTYIGDPNPDFTYGLTNSFSWKNFNLNIFIQGSYGNDIFNASKADVEGMYDLKNQSTNVLKRWRTPGQITDVPKAGFRLEPSSYFIENGSYLRVKDISISYNFKGSFLNKLGISRLQPYFTASNLLTFTKYSGMDPEVNQWGNSGSVQGIDWGTYPHSKSFIFGINVEF